MSLTLKIQIVKINQLKSMKFAPTMSVSEVCAQVKEKCGEGGEDHGLFQPAMEAKRTARWLKNDRTLQFYDLKMNDTLEYKKKHRPLKVKLMDDTVKTVLVDDSLNCVEIVELVGKKMGIKNWEEFSLQVEGSQDWLNSNQSLHEQGVTDEQLVVLKKKFFVEDANISRDDPVQLHLVYVQSRDAIVAGSHPCTYDESIQLAALQSQIQLGNHNPSIHKPGFLKLKEYLPPASQKSKSAEKEVYNEFRKLVGMSEVNAKYRYVQLCRSLKTYGITFFQTKERVKGQKKPVPKLLGITRDAVMRLDAETKEIEHEYPLTHLRRWAASPASFTLDFGDYEEEYVSVITPDGEAISQLLAGYIDILLKKRKDTGVVLEDNENDVATVETVGRLRGQASTATTQSSVGGFDSGSGRESQLSGGQAPMARRGQAPPQGLQVTNVDTAQTAIANIVNEVDAQPLPVPGAVSHLSPQQWKQQLVQSGKAVSAACGKLGAIAAQPQNIDKTAMNNVAKEIAMTVDNMMSSARNATAADEEDPDGEMPLLDGAKAVAEAIAKVLKASKELADHPNDQRAKDQLKAAQDMLGNNMTFLNSAAAGQLADIATTRLIAESAKAIAAATNGLMATAKNVGEDLDPNRKQILMNAAHAANVAGEQCAGVSTTLASAVLDPNCKKALIDSTKAVQNANAYLLAAAQNNGVDPEGMKDLQGAAKAVSDAISQLLTSTEVAEPRVGADPEFTEAARVINTATAALMGAQGNSNLIQQSAKAIAEALPHLIAGAKRAAQKTDDDALRNRILNAAKQAQDAQRGMDALAANAANRPEDPAAFNKLLEASRKLAQLASQLVGDGVNQAAMQQLRNQCKTAAAATTGLVAAARSAAAIMPDDNGEAMNLLASARAAAEAIAALMKPLERVHKNPESVEAQNALLEAAKKMAPQAYKLVAAAKNAAPSVPNKQKKEDLQMAANSAAEAIKDLANSTVGASSAAGDGNFDNALEQFQAMVADLEGAVMFADQGMLEPVPGASKDGAMELLNQTAKNLGNAAKNLVGSSKTHPDQLGPNSRDVASAVQQVIGSAKAIAGTTPNRTSQKAVLGAAKHLAGQAEALVGCARALSAAPKDPSIGSSLNNSAKSVADALSNLLQVAKASDTGAKDLDEALATIQGSLGLLNASPVHMGGDFAANSDRLLASTKAIAAAVSQLIQAAKTNPNGVGSAAKTTAATLPPIIEAANAAAGSAPNAKIGQDIIAGTKAIAGEIQKLLANARNASAKPGDQHAESNLQQSAKAVSEAIKQLLARVENSTPATREINDALEAVRDAIRKLDDPGLANKPGPPLEGLSTAAKALADATAHVLSSRESPDKLSAQARKAAESLGQVVDYAKIAAAAASGQSNEGLEPLASRVADTCNQLASGAASQNLDAAAKKTLIAAAKNSALATSSLVGAARASAMALKPSDPDTAKSILNSAQAVANATAKLVNYAKASAAGTPTDKAQVAKAKSELSDAISDLLNNTSSAPARSSIDEDNLTPAASNLLNAARAIANATAQLLDAGKNAAAGSKDATVFQTMSSAAKSVTSGIQALLGAANGLKPGQKELEEAIEAIQNAAVELDSAALNAAIGLLENSAPPGKTLQKAQEELVELAKEVATGVKDVVTAAKSAPDKLGPAAKSLGNTTPKLAMVAKQCAGLLADNAQQQEQLAAAKNLTDTLLELMVAAKTGNLSDLSQQAKNASLAITQIISPIKPGVMGSKECDDALQNIKDSLGDLNKPIKPGKTYQECQVQLGDVAKALAASINQLANAGKQKPEDVGVAARKVSSVIPPLVELTRLAAAASTDADAKKNLLEGLKNIGDATERIINDAKLAAADRKNPALQAQLAASLKSVTGAISQYVNTLKAAPASEKDLDSALEEISKTMSDLDSALLFAAAGQLEADVTGQSLESCQNNIAQAAKAIAQACNQLVGAAKLSPDQLGGAAKHLGKGLSNVAKLSKMAACLAGDSVSQQSLLGSARTVSIAGQQLVLSARQAHKSGDEVSQTNLSGAAQTLSDALKQLINFAQTASADASKGIIELDNAAADIRKLLSNFDGPAFKGNEKSTPEDIITSAKAVAESTAHLVSACNNNPEDIFQAAQGTHISTRALLENAKGALRLTDDKVVQQNLLEAAKNVANATTRLVSAAKAQRLDAANPAAQQKLSATASDVVDKINEVVAAAGDLPGGERAKKLFAAADNLEEIAEKELMTAASVIEEATRVLLEAKNRAQQKREQMGFEDAGINEAILDAARAIAQATSVLVSSATSCQKEIVHAGKITKSTNVYRRDPTWARGLISAAQSVAGAVQTLVKSANDSTTNQAEEEQLVASARGVAAATARLVTASRAKADPMSVTQQKLSSAAKTVASATSQLVAAAKAASEQEQQEEEIQLSASETGQKIQEMEAQVKILKLKKELENAQKSLFKIRKAEYSGDGDNNNNNNNNINNNSNVSAPANKSIPTAPKGASKPAPPIIQMKKVPAKKPPTPSQE